MFLIESLWKGLNDSKMTTTKIWQILQVKQKIHDGTLSCNESSGTFVGNINTYNNRCINDACHSSS